MPSAASREPPSQGGRRIDIQERIATLRREAQELRFFASAAENPDVRRLLDLEAADREDQADALETWANTGKL